MINDGTEPFCGGAICKKVSKLHNFSLINIIICNNCLVFVFKACDGAETCIVSCHSEQKVWDGSTDIHFSYADGENRTSKLSEITGLSLTDLNIEENDNPNCKTPR